MTKANEIEILRAAASTLGADSYFGPWLATVANEAESLIRSDIVPEIRLADAETYCANLRKRTEEDCKRITDAATAQAAKLVSDARAHAQYVTHKVAATLRAQLKDLDNL